jgi:hypothetical protein
MRYQIKLLIEGSDIKDAYLYIVDEQGHNEFLPSSFPPPLGCSSTFGRQDLPTVLEEAEKLLDTMRDSEAFDIWNDGETHLIAEAILV